MFCAHAHCQTIPPSVSAWRAAAASCASRRGRTAAAQSQANYTPALSRQTQYLKCSTHVLMCKKNLVTKYLGKSARMGRRKTRAKMYKCRKKWTVCYNLKILSPKIIVSSHQYKLLRRTGARRWQKIVLPEKGAILSTTKLSINRSNRVANTHTPAHRDDEFILIFFLILELWISCTHAHTSPPYLPHTTIQCNRVANMHPPTHRAVFAFIS